MNRSDKMTLEEVLQMSLDEYIAETGLHYSPFSSQKKVDRNKNSNVEMCEQVEGVIEEGTNTFECDLSVNVQQNHERHKFQASSQQGFTRRGNRINPFGTWNPRQSNNYKRSRRSKNRKRNINNKKYYGNIFDQGEGKNFSMQNRDNNANNLTFQSSMHNMSKNIHKSPNDMTATNSNAPSFIITNAQRNQSFMRPLPSIAGNNQYDFTNYSNPNPQTTMLANTCGNITTEIMPYLTAKLLELLSNNTPKYDMTIQKEIHSIQGKPIVYRCNGNGGDLISSDGPGLNCVLTPAATALTLNQRFA